LRRWVRLAEGKGRTVVWALRARSPDVQRPGGQRRTRGPDVLDWEASHEHALQDCRGEIAYLATYERMLQSWPVAFDQIEVPTPFGTS